MFIDIPSELEAALIDRSLPTWELDGSFLATSTMERYPTELKTTPQFEESATILRHALTGDGGGSNDSCRDAGELRSSGRPRSLLVTVGRLPTAHRRPTEASVAYLRLVSPVVGLLEDAQAKGQMGSVQLGEEPRPIHTAVDRD
ncbi:hypothetical protein ACGFWD_39385 [Streptomyces sp. NPDC048448]|uniref:hypothetical protein n=1 Tax=Streptomyces sp. NPDC048448 TaxID=3365554 RepID=UPI00371FB147